jgi:pimeloyl-ACP methyl ester carboxylesterase
MPTIDLSAGTLDYVDTGGDGPVIMFVHGLVMDASVWSDVISRLRSDHRCVAPTLPLGGHRRPMRDDADLSMVGQAHLLAEFVDRLGVDDVTLVVNDWGGPLVTAVEHPERLGRLVLTPCEAFDNLPPGLPGRFAAFAARMPGGLAIAAQSLRIRMLRRQPMTFGWMIRDPVPDDLFDGWIGGLRSNRGVRRDVARYVRTTDMSTLDRLTPQLAELPMPVLVAWGDHGRVMPVEHGQRLADLVPDGRYVEIPDTRVVTPLDAPARLAELIREFVAATPRPPADATVARPAVT